ncbi:hypothetical protein [Rubrivivax gelatinosus]|uniref:Uncharacterized protein n=1 Tax=Rubrivivax gelatinosus (strain NBRC 100245 / IL144) TaxID=983917 RepID=I0HQE5_RUBGI|nr:hypothetical protein [Rubrivivax gelatinosus]BAL95232.1 hypothetical protein RGE_18910 [Rubrivivax gelatinosus IL144]
MIKVHSSIGPEEWQPLALCRRYVVVHFKLPPAQAEKDADLVLASLMWAVATHADGHHALLGAWSVPGGSDIAWPEILSELWTRGAERIEWAVVPGGAPPAAIADAEVTKVVHWRDASAPEPVLPPRTKRLLDKSDDVAQRLHAAMLRAARRQGGRFDSAEAAFASLQRQWRRLERRLDAEHAARASRRSGGTAAASAAPGR